MLSIQLVTFGEEPAENHFDGAKTLKATAEMNLWPQLAPGEKPDTIGEEKAVTGKENEPIIRVENVSAPTLTLYQPEAKNRKDACVIIFPGGGYNILAYNHEGTEIAHWLNSIGVSAVVVKYRVPRRADLEKHLAPLQDAQRAIRLVRSHAKEWNIDPNKIGVLGFSAGGHLTIMAATNYDEKVYEPVDDVDKISARPDFAAPIYPAYLMGEKVDHKRIDVPLEENVKIDAKTPPMFLTIADDDWVGSMGSVQTYMKLKEAGVPCELHVFMKGGHGYGIRPDRGPAAQWHKLCAKWLQEIIK
ncbi:MAG: alpha/beta hydrolase [Thermoguttaceae bacterium]